MRLFIGLSLSVICHLFSKPGYWNLVKAGNGRESASKHCNNLITVKSARTCESVFVPLVLILLCWVNSDILCFQYSWSLKYILNSGRVNISAVKYEVWEGCKAAKTNIYLLKCGWLPFRLCKIHFGPSDHLFLGQHSHFVAALRFALAALTALFTVTSAYVTLCSCGSAFAFPPPDTSNVLKSFRCGIFGILRKIFGSLDFFSWFHIFFTVKPRRSDEIPVAPKNFWASFRRSCSDASILDEKLSDVTVSLLSATHPWSLKRDVVYCQSYVFTVFHCRESKLRSSFTAMSERKWRSFGVYNLDGSGRLQYVWTKR